MSRDRDMSGSKDRGISRPMHNTYSDGLLGEAHFLDFASRNQWQIYRGMTGHEPYDYIVDTGEELIRVEVKAILSVQHTQNNYYFVTATKMDTSLFDWMFIHTPTGNYWIPAEACPTTTVSIKQVGGDYRRNITRPGKYEVYRI